jgi:cytochrome c oxidase subunit 2
MDVQTYEKGFVAMSCALLLACLGGLLWAAVARDIHLIDHAEQVDPSALALVEPFARPGVRQTGPEQYEAVVIGRIWSFDPGEIRIPRGAEVTFVATSADVIHGLHVAATRVNLMLIPGQVARFTYRFRRPGEYLLICHEYCGVGHHTMGGKVIVE